MSYTCLSFARGSEISQMVFWMETIDLLGSHGSSNKAIWNNHKIRTLLRNNLHNVAAALPDFRPFSQLV